MFIFERGHWSPGHWRVEGPLALGRGRSPSGALPPADPQGPDSPAVPTVAACSVCAGTIFMQGHLAFHLPLPLSAPDAQGHLMGFHACHLACVEAIPRITPDHAGQGPVEVSLHPFLREAALRCSPRLCGGSP